MPVTLANDGTQTATLDTDHTLTTQTVPLGGGVYQLRVDTANLANGERLVLRLQARARVGGTTRDVYTTTFEHVQGDPLKDSPVVAALGGTTVVAILRQEGGTGRDFEWALYRLDG